jgi:hypothetical protein
MKVEETLIHQKFRTTAPTEQDMRLALRMARETLLDANRNGFTRSYEALKVINDILMYTPQTPAAVYHPSNYDHHPVNKIEKI